MPKTHFSRNGFIACSQTKGRTTSSTAQTTCLSCQKTEVFATSDARQKLLARQAFEAQEPREFAEPWKQGTIECSHCTGRLFRDAGRSCHGHYQDYVCADCGETTSRLTETGMCF